MEQLEGVWSHDCDEYLKKKLKSAKEKITYLRDSSKYHSDIHKALCTGCKTCSSTSSFTYLQASEQPYAERIWDNIKRGMATMLTVGSEANYPIVLADISDPGCIESTGEEQIFQRMFMQAHGLL